jgi:hypothetical protein
VAIRGEGKGVRKATGSNHVSASVCGSSEYSGSHLPTPQLTIRSSPMYPSLCARGRELRVCEELRIKGSALTLNAESERGMKSSTVFPRMREPSEGDKVRVHMRVRTSARRKSQDTLWLTTHEDKPAGDQPASPSAARTRYRRGVSDARVLRASDLDRAKAAATASAGISSAVEDWRHTLLRADALKSRRYGV